MPKFKPGDLVVLQLPGGDHMLEPSCSAIGIVISVRSTTWVGDTESWADIIWPGNNLAKEVPASYLELYESCD